MKHTRQDLKIMQGWSLERKIRVTQTRIMEWYMRYDGQVFISFSGGKDSTVLLDLARRVYPDIPAVYVDTGLEYPELRDFVKTKDNVIWLRPRYPFTQILEKYGYPIISKEVSDVINGARKGQPYRLARLNGELLDKNGKKSIYNCENYKYLLDAPFKISARCCYHMKKAPLNKFERQSGRHPITGVLACESKLREQSWIKFGCNGFERQRPLSQPLAFWLEEDILRYLKMTGIPYAPIYGDIVESRKKNGTPILKTTGVSRSGCMYCMQKAILKQTIIELYNQFGIFWETDIRQLKATDFPILSDLHALLEKKAEANKENPVYRDLAMLLYDAAAGSDSFLWNGHTTLEANSRFICLDTHDLQNASDNVKRTQYLNLLSWCWEEMSRDRNERCLLVCDEAYLMIDPQVPQSLVFLRNVEKRARKYEAGLAIISHSVVDFLAPEVKMYGQALLDIPCYKILMGCDGKNLQETKDLYNLTDAEQELLESKRRGHALFIIGSKRLHVNFEIPAYKFSYMGKAGGR